MLITADPIAFHDFHRHDITLADSACPVATIAVPAALLAASIWGASNAGPAAACALSEANTGVARCGSESTLASVAVKEAAPSIPAGPVSGKVVWQNLLLGRRRQRQQWPAGLICSCTWSSSHSWAQAATWGSIAPPLPGLGELPIVTALLPATVILLPEGSKDMYG